ncbi:hypothetical protein D3C78_1338570 [compost metagenome]
MAWISSCTLSQRASGRRPRSRPISSPPSRLSGNTPRPRAANTDISALSSNSPTTLGSTPCSPNQRSSVWRNTEWPVGSSTGSRSRQRGKSCVSALRTSRAGPYQSTADDTRRSLVRRRLGLAGAPWPASTRSRWCCASSPSSSSTSPSWQVRRRSGVSSTGPSKACAASFEMPSDRPTDSRMTGLVAAARTSWGSTWPIWNISSARAKAASPASVRVTPRPAGLSS